MSDPITLFHRAKAVGIQFRESPEGWVADCSPELWEKWQPVFVEHWPEVLRSLRPALASNRQATSSVIRISPEAWGEAGQAIERAKLAAISELSPSTINTAPPRGGKEPSTMNTLARVELGIESPEGVESGISINIMDVMLGVGVAVFIADCF